MIIRLSPSRFLWLSRYAPPSLPALASFQSWRTRPSGWLALASVRLPFLWLLYLRWLPSQARLRRIGYPPC